MAERSLLAQVIDDQDDFADVADERGDELLDDVASYLGRFVCFANEHQGRTIAVWVMSTWMIERLDTTGRLFIRSHLTQSGKSTALEILRLLCRRAQSVAGASAAALYRTITALGAPALLIDEIDTIWHRGRSTGSTGDLRRILNAGYSNRNRVSKIMRTVRSNQGFTPTPFETFAPVVLAGIGKGIPDTVLDRSVVITLERARRATVEKFRRRIYGSECSSRPVLAAVGLPSRHDASARARRGLSPAPERGYINAYSAARGAARRRHAPAGGGRWRARPAGGGGIALPARRRKRPV